MSMRPAPTPLGQPDRKGEGPGSCWRPTWIRLVFWSPFIDKEGFVHFRGGGRPQPADPGQPAGVLLNGVRGVIGRTGKPIEPSKLSFNDLFIDIGAASKEQAEQLVAIGDLAVPAFFYQQTGSRMTCGSHGQPRGLLCGDRGPQAAGRIYPWAGAIRN